MHPTVVQAMMNARVADKHRRAERHRTANAAARSKRKPAPYQPAGHLTVILNRYASALRAARRLWRPPALARQAPAPASALAPPETKAP